MRETGQEACTNDEGGDMAVVSRRKYIGRSIVLCQRKERHNLRGLAIDGWVKIVKVDLGLCREIYRYTCMYVLEANKAHGEG